MGVQLLLLDPARGSSEWQGDDPFGRGRIGVAGTSAHCLEDYDYKVLEAGSGVQALKVWEQHKEEIHMLLTDMVMPEGMTGRDLAERLQTEKPEIKVLYSSGYSPDVVGGYFKLPENSFFLAKPYHPPKLAQAVRECLDNVRQPNTAPMSLSHAA